MKTPQSNGITGGNRSGSRRATRLWFAAILALASAAWLLLTLTGVSDGGRSLLFVAEPLVVVALVVGFFSRRRKRREHRQLFPTPEDVHRHVDTVALRDLRDRKGVLHAVKTLREVAPSIPLNEAAELIKGL